MGSVSMANANVAIEQMMAFIHGAAPLIYQTKNDIIFFKNCNFEYVGCNQNLVNFSRLGSENALLGRQDSELPWAEDFEFFRSVDEKIIHGEERDILLDVKVAGGERRYGSQQKSPIRNRCGEIIGMMVRMRELDAETSASLAQIAERDNTILKSSHLPTKYIIDSYKKYNLTNRESQCLFYIVRGYQIKSIADYLGTSPRTIERFVSEIKIKLECNNRAAIIDKVHKDGLMNIIPSAVNMKFLNEMNKGS